jgi:type VI secretion system protein ImpC
MPTRLELDLTTARPPAAAGRKADGEPMRLLLCGDFSGRGARGLDDPQGVAARMPLRVDVDNLDGVLHRLAPAVVYDVDGRSSDLGFQCLDDFHPDRLCQWSPLFADLDAHGGEPPATGADSTGATSEGPRQESDAATLERLLGRPATAAGRGIASPPSSAVEAAVDALVRRITAADSAASAPAAPAGVADAVNAARAERLRALLHEPAFQALEAAWRSVHLLVSRLPLDAQLELHLFDLTRGELAAAAAAHDLQQNGLWKALVDRPGDAAAGNGWSMVVSLASFDASGPDISMLASLATTAAATGAPVLAGASPRLFGREAWSVTADPDTWPALDAGAAARWQALRASPLAQWIGLVAPQLLLRLPYGAHTDPIDTFDFDELSGSEPAASLLWGQPAVGCAVLAGLAFAEAGWQLDLDRALDIDDLPAWVQDQDGERRLYPCAGSWLGERAAETMLALGVMPLLSRRDAPAARLLRWQSIAATPTALAVPWRR